MRRTRRKLVEKIEKDTGEHLIELVAGIEPNPPDPYPNSIFYIRMKSTEKETGFESYVKPIWLSLNEMTKLSVLMTLASRFWLERLDKDTEYAQERVTDFIRAWKKMRNAIDDVLP
jgi:hypothetical protein